MSIGQPRYLHGLFSGINAAEWSPAGEVPLWVQCASYKSTSCAAPLVIGMTQAKVRIFP